jgi:hypothetical protein
MSTRSFSRRESTPESAAMMERHGYVLREFSTELASRLDAETANKIVALFMEKIGKPNQSSKDGYVSDENVKEFWTKFEQLIPVKMRKDALDELANGGSVSDVLIIFGAITHAAIACGNKEASHALDAIYRFAKEEMK